jgi:peptidyl-prolyl cis-trans isomerase C
MKTVRSVTIAGLALLLAAGCGKKTNDAKVVASAGDIKVTLADLYTAYDKISVPNRPDISTLEGKRRFANDLVNKEILLAEAKRMGGITDAATLAQLDKAFQSRLLGILYREEIEAKVDVTAQDVTELYEKRKEGVEASHVLVEDSATAAKIREEIVSGKITFAKAAEKYSLDQSTNKKGGSLGVLLWGRATPAFQQMAFELEPGKISEPVDTNFGTHLILVHKRVPQTMGTREEMAPTLRNEARRQKEQVRLKEYVAEIEARSNVQWNEEALALLGQLTEDLAGKDVDTIPIEQQYIPEATDEQKKLVLVTYLDKSLTIGDYTKYLSEQPYTNRPQTRLPKRALQELIKGTILQNELLVHEAYAMKLNERPEAVSEDARIREQVLIEMVHARFIQEADVPEEDAKAIFDSTLAAQPEDLRIPERVDMKVLVSMKEDVVRAGLRRIRAGESEDKVVRELSEDMRTKFSGGSTGMIARGNYAPKLEDVAFARKPGTGWSDPVVTETGVGSVKVVGYEPSRIATFEDMKTAITQRLAFTRGEKAFEDWLMQQRETLKVEVHDDVLELMGQPVSGQAAGQPGATQPPGGAPPAAQPPPGQAPAAPPASGGGS